MFNDFLNQTFSSIRVTSFLQERRAAAGLTNLLNQPTDNLYLLIRSYGTESGSIFLSGFNVGVTTTETLSFVGESEKQSSNRYSSISSISVSGLSNNEISIKQITGSGQPVEANFTYITGPCRVEKDYKYPVIIAPGELPRKLALMFCRSSEGSQLHLKDKLTIENDVYRVDSIRPLRNRNSVHHYEIELEYGI